MKVKYLLQHVYVWTQIDLVDCETKKTLKTDYIWPSEYDNWEVEGIQPDGLTTIKIWIKKPKIKSDLKI